jgi:phosphoenolpyruvate synthase/pyruvate phosphate dikinase
VIHWLGEPESADRGLVGGKAAALGRLAALHAVPAGFVATPGAGQDEVCGAYEALARRLGTRAPAVAVRSSAVDEDGDLASLAGQYETYLNVTGADRVADAVRRCRESATAARALAYRRERGMGTGAGMPVLVQQLVRADVSAVAFSVNPVTGADEIVVNAAYGLGESIVGGTTTPDTFILVKPGLDLGEVQVGSKERMTVATPAGTREVAVPALMRGRPCLDPGAAREIGALALALERRTGHAVDVECAFAGASLHLLQCRPVTAAGRTFSEGST